VNSIDEKLQNFTKTVMMEAAEKRVEIINKAQQEKEKKIEKSEIQALEKAYDEIQKVVRKAIKEKNEKISRTLIGSKKTLFIKRQEVIDEIFHELINEIENIKNEDRYFDFLLKKVFEGISQAGEGYIEIFVDSSDEKSISQIHEKIKEKYDTDIKILVDDEKIIGGCKVLNKDKNILIDNSLKSSINEEREKFLKNSGLIIN
jgi:vacuolar-type H+-ATPase subunit E/Vma4